MNRDQLAALARGTVTMLAGVALFYAIGRFLGWWTLGVVVAAGLGACAVDYWRGPGWWRMW